jgi:hypothetical protein
VSLDLDGVIASAGFESGDRFVCGLWRASPIGVLHDVMWARPSGERVLLVASDAARDFVTGVYDFDRVEIVPVSVSNAGPRRIDLVAGDVEIALVGGRVVPIPGPRPLWVTRWIEGPIARATMGVRTYGVSPTGVQEWYRARSYRRVVSGHASVAGADLGALRPIDPPCGFGFSEPPRRPSIVEVHPHLVLPPTADPLLPRRRRLRDVTGVRRRKRHELGRDTGHVCGARVSTDEVRNRLCGS